MFRVPGGAEEQGRSHTSIVQPRVDRVRVPPEASRTAELLVSIVAVVILAWASTRRHGGHLCDCLGPTDGLLMRLLRSSDHTRSGRAARMARSASRELRIMQPPPAQGRCATVFGVLSGEEER